MADQNASARKHRDFECSANSPFWSRLTVFLALACTVVTFVRLIRPQPEDRVGLIYVLWSLWALSIVLSMRFYREFVWDSPSRSFLIQRGGWPFRRDTVLDARDVVALCMISIKPFRRPFKDLYRDMLTQYAVVTVTQGKAVQPICVKESREDAQKVAEAVAVLLGIPISDELPI